RKGLEFLAVSNKPQNFLLVVLVEGNLLVRRFAALLQLVDDLFCGELATFLQDAHRRQPSLFRYLGQGLDLLLVAIDRLKDFASRAPTDELRCLLDQLVLVSAPVGYVDGPAHALLALAAPPFTFFTGTGNMRLTTLRSMPSALATCS